MLANFLKRTFLHLFCTKISKQNKAPPPKKSPLFLFSSLLKQRLFTPFAILLRKFNNFILQKAESQANLGEFYRRLNQNSTAHGECILSFVMGIAVVAVNLGVKTGATNLCPQAPPVQSQSPEFASFISNFTHYLRQYFA